MRDSRRAAEERKRELLVWTVGILAAVAIALGGLSAVLGGPAAVLRGLGFSLGGGRVVSDGEKADYQVVLLGDSLIGNLNDGTGVAACLEELLGVSVLKGGFGGTCASYNVQEQYPSETSGQLSLAQISRAIVNGDFFAQKSLIAYGDHYENITGQTLEYFSESANALSAADFGQVRYLVIEHGTNDYNTGVLPDNKEDPYDETTFGGALRSAIERLRKAYPEMKIILMTPTWCYITRGGEHLYCDETDFGGGLLEEYALLELKIAEEYGLPILDNYHDSGICAETADLFLYDGLHLNSQGQKLIAGRLAELIGELEAEE